MHDEAGEAIDLANGTVIVAGSGLDTNVRGLSAHYADAVKGPPFSTLLWQSQPGLLSSEVFMDVSATAEGDYYAGRTWSDAKHAGPLLAKFPKNSPTALWVVKPKVRDAYHDGAYHAVLPVEENGTVVIYAAGFTAEQEANRPAVLVKYDKDGNPLWSKNLSGTAAGHRAAGVSLATSDGFIYVAGYLAKGKKAPDFEKVAPTVALWKYDSSGNNVWTVNESDYKLHQFKDEAKEVKMGLLASEGYLYLATGQKKGVKSNVFVLKYDLEGKLVWSTAWNSKTSKGQPDYSIATAVAEGKDRIYVSGWTSYSAHDTQIDEDGLLLEIDKRYGFVLAEHEYGESKALERLLDAKADGARLYLTGASKDLSLKEKANHDLTMLRYTIRAPFKVAIDILPGDAANALNPGDSKAGGKISVVLFSSKDFNAATVVNKKSLRFGRIGHEPTWKGASVKDVNKDGIPDLVCTFKTVFQFQKKPRYLLEPGDKQGILKGDTNAGEPFVGMETVFVEATSVAPVEEDSEPLAEAPAPEPAPIAEMSPTPSLPEPQVTSLIVSQPVLLTNDPAPASPTESQAPVAIASQPAPSTTESVSTAAPSSVPPAMALPTNQGPILVSTTATSPDTQVSETTAINVASTSPVVVAAPVVPVVIFGMQTTNAESPKTLASKPLPPPSISPVVSRESLQTSALASPATFKPEESRILFSEESVGGKAPRNVLSSPDPSSERSTNEDSIREKRGSGLFQAYYDEGQTALKRGHFGEAAAFFREALSQNPDSPEANRLLGLVLAESGDLRGARVYLSKALKLNPLDTVARQKLETIQSPAS